MVAKMLRVSLLHLMFSVTFTMRPTWFGDLIASLIVDSESNTTDGTKGNYGSAIIHIA